jgi:hypothetical protein
MRKLLGPILVGIFLPPAVMAEQFHGTGQQVLVPRQQARGASNARGGIDVPKWNFDTTT